jgi:hypothetical protein
MTPDVRLTGYGDGRERTPPLGERSSTIATYWPAAQPDLGPKERRGAATDLDVIFGR